MSKFLSGRLRRLLVGITGYTENNTVVQTTGKVGIGTTDAQQHSLYVVGSTNITGDNIVGGGLTAVGIGSFQDDVYIDNELYVGGVNVTGGANIGEDITTRNLKVTGISTVVGISTVESTLFAKELSVAGVSTFVGGTEIPDNSIARFGDVVNVLDTSVYHTGNTFYIENFSSSSNLSVNFDSSLSFGNGGGTGLYLFTDPGTLESYVEVQYTDPNTLGNADSGSFRVDGGAGIADNLTVGAGLSVTDGAFLNDVNVTGIVTATAFHGAIKIDESEDDDVAYNVVFTDTVGGGDPTNPHHALQIDNGGLTFNPGSNTLFSQNASHSGNIGLGAYLYHSSDVDTFIGFPINDTVTVKTNGVDRIYATSVGNVGINTTVPAYALDVTGTGRFTSAVDLDSHLRVSGITTTLGLLDIDAGGQANTFKVEDLTEDRIVVAGSGGELEDDANLTFNGSQLSIGVDLDVDGHTELDNVNVSGVATITSLNVQTNFDVYDSQAVFHNDLYVTGNLSIGGTTTALQAQDLKIFDKDIILGVTTDAYGNDISTDTTANHAGVAVASTEGSPLVNLTIPGLEELPSTYKKIMWFREGTFAGLGTDAWLINYAVGIGSTQFPSGTRLAAGQIQLSEDTVTTPNLGVSGSSDLHDLYVAGISTFAGVSTFQSDITVGSAITAYAATGIVSAIAFYGDGSNLTNTGATLSATSGVERLVTTQLTSGTMVDAATDADLTFDAGTNTLNTENIKISGGISTNGTDYGQQFELLRAKGNGEWEWATVPGIFSVNNILNGFNVLEEGGTVGTAGSIHTLDFRGINVTASADPQPNGIATVTFSSTPTFTDITVTGNTTIPNVVGVTTFTSDIDVDGLAELDDVNVTGVSTFQNNVHLLDNDKLLLGGAVGTHDGLEIYHDSNHSYIDDSGTGNLYLRSGTLAIQNLAGSKTSALFQSGSGQEFYHNNTKRLETTGYGVTVYNDLRVGTAVTIYGNAGIVSATAFHGDGSNLSNTSAALSAAAGTQRLVLTSLTSGTMVDAATDGDLNFTAETNELAVPNLDVGTAAEISRLNVTGVSTFSNDVTFDGATTGRDITFDRSSNALQFEDWATAKFGSGTDNLSIYHNGANSIISNDGNDSGSLYIRVTKDSERVHIQSDDGNGGIANYFAAYGNVGEARLYHFGNQKFTTKEYGIEVTGTTDTDQLNVSGVSTFQAKIEGAATNNVIPFLYANYSDLPNAGTYHGAFAHVHATGKAYFAHANAWYELVNKDLNGVVGTGTETYNVANINITGITTLGGPVTAGSSEGVAGQYLRHVGTGVTWANFPTLRTTQTFTALAGQTTFNFTYNVDFLDVYVNGVKLSPSEYTATNGSDVVLDVAAFAGDTVELYSYNTASTYGGGGGSSYTDANVNTHLNVSGASAGQILSWNGSDYAWVADQTGGGGSGITTANINADSVDSKTLNVTGVSTFNSTVELKTSLYLNGASNSSDLYIGSSNQVKLEHSGSHAFWINTAGSSYVRGAAGFIVQKEGGGYDDIIKGIADGAVELYYDDVKKFETTEAGAVVTGILTATSFSGDGSALTGLTGASAATYGNATAVPQITVDANGRITGITNVSISGGGGGGGTSLFIRDSGSLVGSAGTIDFGTGLSVTPVSAGIVTVTSSGISLTDLSVTQNSAGTAALSYNDSTGVFSYTPPDLSSYLTSYTETDPIVGAVNGIVKANGSGTISAATAGTDYLAPGSEFTSQWTFSASGSSNYQVTGPGFAANSADPTIYVMRGHKYKFTNNAGSHPLQIQYEFENPSGTAYTDGITNSNNIITWEVRNDTPDLLHYQCTSHQYMSGRIVVLGDVVTTGEWTASAGTPQTIDTITGVANNDIKTAEYTIHIENGSNMQAQKVLVMQDGTTAYSQEYGIMHKSGLLVSMSATISGGDLLLQATPETGVSGTTTYKITRQTMR